ncbi:MAG: type I DNA topoisomerase [Anaerolineae bacterium]|nr:type I DNA topoisomerase [Anaerolineae bacterium]
MKLVIIESSAKKQKLTKLLSDLYGAGVYKVLASLGHIRDLPAKELGVDVQNGFQPKYTIVKGKSKTIKLLSKQVSKADELYLASDPDREGESIAWHLIQVTRPQIPTFRVTFNEITQSAVKKAFDNPRQLNMDLVAAQEARRILDRLVGYKVSPALWRGLDASGLSAGRVQSVALGLVVERQSAIDTFVQREYWSIIGTFAVPTGQFDAKLVMWSGKPWTTETYCSHQDAHIAISSLSDLVFKIQKLEHKQRRRKAPIPFITSTLQQAASSHLRISPDKTMSIAQTLYVQGLITYMRSDSPAVSVEAADAAETFIRDTYGDLYLPEVRRQFKAKVGAQEAHECIRPTNVTLDELSSDHDDYSSRLYQLIWQRFIASQMADAHYDQTTIVVAGSKAVFMARNATLEFDGFLKIYLYGDDLKEEHQARPTDEDQDIVFPLLAENQICRAEAFEPKQHFTRPPATYSEASLVKALETLGIGRPSTYSLMVSTIRQRKYVVLKNRRLAPTMLGEQVSRFLDQHFALVVNYDFTKMMEDALDKISMGELNTRKFLTTFWNKFYPLVEPWQHAPPNQRSEPKLIGELCPVCGKGQIEIKRSRKGRFLGCNRYPACKYSRDMQTPAPVLVGRVCPDCGSQLCVRSKRDSADKFIGCTHYPTCKHTENSQPDVAGD